MCDEDIHQGVTQNPRLSRRAFGLSTTAAAMVAAAAAKGSTEAAERDVDVATSDGSADAVLLHPTGQGRWPAVLIWTDILGLRPVFRQMGKRQAAEGYVVLVPNSFYRVRRAPIAEGPLDFAKLKDRAKVMPLAAALTPEGTARRLGLRRSPRRPAADRQGQQGPRAGLLHGRPADLPQRRRAANRFAAAATFHGVRSSPTSPPARTCSSRR